VFGLYDADAGVGIDGSAGALAAAGGEAVAAGVLAVTGAGGGCVD
jgi:hypothetical protein